MDAFDTPLDPMDERSGRIARMRAYGGAAVQTRPAILSPLRAGIVANAVRMQGENPQAEISMFLPEGVAPAILGIAHRSSVEALPERSPMRILVNGTAMEEVTPGNLNASNPVEIAVPGNIWIPGRNHIRVAIRQVHRIFCGPAAAFDLWTDIDPAGSGAVRDAQVVVPGRLDFLAAAAHDAAVTRATEIRDPSDLAVVAPSILNEVTLCITDIISGMPLAHRASDIGGVDDTSYAGLAGTDPVLRGPSARITLMPTGPRDTAAPEIAFRRGGDGAEVMVVHVPGDGEGTARVTRTAIDMMDRPVASVAPEPKAATALDARQAMPVGVPVSLGSLGFQTVRTTSHYFRKEQVFTLPRDCPVMTAQKAMLHLDDTYVRDLPDKSMLLTKINGQTVRLLPLVGDGGRSIEQFPIKFYANLLKEGPNSLQFEALVPGAPQDRACPVGDPVNQEISGSSTLTVPDSPAMRLPDIRLPDIRLPVSRLTAGEVRVDGQPLNALPVDERLSLVTSLGHPAAVQAGLTVLPLGQPDDLPMGDCGIAWSSLREVLLKVPPAGPTAAPVAAAPTVGDCRVRMARSSGSAIRAASRYGRARSRARPTIWARACARCASVFRPALTSAPRSSWLASRAARS